MRTAIRGTLAVGSILAGVNLADAAVSSERVATGLNQPIFATHAPGDASKLYILERGGDVEVLDLATGGIATTPLLRIPSAQINAVGEGGLLGLAFDPDFATNGRLYINMTSGNTVGHATDPFRSELRRYTAVGGVASAASFDTLLSYSRPDTNHVGGWIGFNPQAGAGGRHDLYIMSGDGGGANDTGTGHTPNLGNAQDVAEHNLFGKVLRINVAGASATNPSTNPFIGVAGDNRIFAHGLRNPFRASFDRLTGELYIGDVGQGAREEIDRLDPSLIDSGTSRAPVRNFGWRSFEGTLDTGFTPQLDYDDTVAPIYDYSRPGNAYSPAAFRGRTVTGGVVYRGPVAELQGKYVFADYADNKVWAFDAADPYGSIVDLTGLLDTPTDGYTINNIVAFGEDAAGNAYVVDIGGEVFRIVPEPASLTAAAAGAMVLFGQRRRITNEG